MAVAPVKPLIAIVGATGTGKSELAVEIARKYNGEIINGDAMQLYKGLPIITNKITRDEMKGQPHHLLDCIGLDEETWTVGNFVKKAVQVIEEIHSRGKVPILVGGTHYYTQSLLFKDATMEGENTEHTISSGASFPILEEPTEVILEKLKEVDPVMADRWHPNERRKIQRSLEIYLKTGKPASQIYDERRLKQEVSLTSEDGEENKAGFRFPTLILWVHAARDVLSTRLDSRIDKMIQRGLLDEVRTLSNFKSSYEDQTKKQVDQTRGIWVSIGYKEFLDYQAALNNPSISDKELENARIAAVEKMQAATRQYAKRQVRWIRIKLLNALINVGQQKHTFLVDGSDISKWNETVAQPALSITESFLLGKTLPDPLELTPAASEMLTPKRDYDLSQRPDLWKKRTCETCGTFAVNENDWNLHIKSRAHRRAVGAKKKLENAPSPGSRRTETVREDMIDVLTSSIDPFDESVVDEKS
ncbi:tRNA isopentenyltransferase [Periconia macrospinosa]|uniref:tRNA dimethylallyltransferase n=1 Tax=Periconia macrospinosa TaxID=97972 RepID=A0A2V1E4U8_9PLEO|nr:tRNA isopentenyltransferase [Periconia macrospinosa]